VQKGFVQIRPAFVADREPTIRRKPGKRPLDHPPVPPQPSARILAPPGDAYSNTALVQSPPAMREVVAFVRVQLLRTFAGSASARRFDRRNRIQELLEDFGVMDVRRSKDNGKWEAGRVGQQVAFGARLAAIGRIRPDLLTPFLAGTVAESTHARDQSMAPHRPSRSSRFLKRRTNTPAFCQSRKRRQHVTPLPYPSCLGRLRHGIPALRT
jgi:hypothetical protein